MWRKLFCYRVFLAVIVILTTLFASTAIYLSFYYWVIPISVQLAPVEFKLQVLEPQDIPESGFRPQPALHSILNIKNKAYSNVKFEETPIDGYIYENN